MHIFYSVAVFWNRIHVIRKVDSFKQNFSLILSQLQGMVLFLQAKKNIEAMEKKLKIVYIHRTLSISCLKLQNTNSFLSSFRNKIILKFQKVYMSKINYANYGHMKKSIWTIFVKDFHLYLHDSFCFIHDKWPQGISNNLLRTKSLHLYIKAKWPTNFLLC